MTFTSLSDLYFITLGLYMYNVLIDVFIETGALFIPFIAVVFGEIKNGVGRGYPYGQILKTVKLKVYGIMAAFIFVINPFTPLQVDGMESYNRSCDESSMSQDINNKIDYATIRKELENPEEGGNEDNQLDQMMVNISGRDIGVPPLIQLVLRMGTGASLMVVKSLPCSVDLSAVSGKLLTDNIKDKRLLAETRQFVQQCHNKVRNMATTANDKNFPWIEKANSDISDWPGFPGYMNDAYYGNKRIGINTNLVLDGYENYYENGKRPTCREWWQGKGAGISTSFSASSSEKSLKERLFNEIDPQSQKIMNAMSNDQSSKDQILQHYYFNPYRFSEIMSAETKDYGSESEGFLGGAADYIYRGMATLGMVANPFTSNPTASVIQIAAPIAKSIILMVILSVLPLAFVVGYMNAKYIVGVTMFIFSIMLWPAFWELTMLAQQNFVEEAMGGSALEAMTNPNIILVSKQLTDALFLAFPSLITALLTAAGMQGGQSMGNMASSGGGKAGASGASGGMAAASKGAKIAKTVATKGKG
ncbi:MAG: conjugal transfer protein TraG [Alteromonadales bacterium]|nr:conjugal transfer protein TraG [Alteromonadales bacterium]MCP4987467.1 conjugal transfer protein TraG [Colwellia sp.]